MTPAVRWKLGICAVAIAIVPADALAASRAASKPVQGVALLTTAHDVHASPGRGTARTSSIAPRRPITGVRTALPIVGRAGDSRGVRWLRVMLPGRPNGRAGWIVQSGTVLARTDWRIDVQLSTRRVTVYRRGRLQRVFKAIVGAPSTPTPRGRFFVEETVRMLQGSDGGPYALALSAHSDVLQAFRGGEGQVAIHGMANLAGRLGTASSHGCVRLTARSIRWLALHIAPGVPVSITA